MPENDPYLTYRLEAAKRHKVVQELTVNRVDNAEPNINLPNPIIEDTVENLAWSTRAVDNLIDAVKNNYIKIELLEDGKVKIELLPIQNLPVELGHVCELEVFHKNESKDSVFGSEEENTYTYLQTTDFAAEGNIADEVPGKKYIRVYVDSQKLKSKRNVFIDPESFTTTDYEYGYAFCVKGGIPISAIKKIEVIKAAVEKKAINSYDNENEDEWLGPDDFERQRLLDIDRLRNLLKNNWRGV